MEITTGVAIVALLISFWSIYTTRRLWSLENRPIITAEIQVDSSGVGIALLNLVVHNSGNRPATNIYFKAEPENIKKIISKNATKPNLAELNYIFSKDASIALLLGGQSTKTAFFSFSSKSDESDILIGESSLPIKIYYTDIKENSYTSNLLLSIKDKEGFGGSVWV